MVLVNGTESNYSKNGKRKQLYPFEQVQHYAFITPKKQRCCLLNWSPVGRYKVVAQDPEHSIANHVQYKVFLLTEKYVLFYCELSLYLTTFYSYIERFKSCSKAISIAARLYFDAFDEF
ncbi:hypothetical protein ACTG4T_00315 [Enterococcus faecium]|uniref:hypothetical protein n=1 Tax=Enterococcus faecium TaxID=1352 RepID=UPI003F7B0612